MMFLSRFFLTGVALCLFSSAYAKENTMWFRSLSDCAGFSSPEARKICSRVIRSREVLDSVHPRLVADATGRVVAREVFLAAWDTEPHIVKLHVSFRAKDASGLKKVTLTPGYDVEHVAGTGLYKLQFRVMKDGRELHVYGGKHVWIPQSHANLWQTKELRPVMEERQYLPFHPHLYHPELAKRGQRFLEELIDEARGELTDVPSRAFPDLSLPQTSPREILVGLIASEHTDPYKLFDKRVKAQVPREQYIFGTLIEIAMHGPNAFAELCSRAPACGWTQFTNTVVLKPNKKTGVLEMTWPGTYNYTYANCRTKKGKAVLLEDFKEGTRNAKNAVKAAICYLDLETAALPQEARDELRRNLKFGSVIALSAFNAGGGWSNHIQKSLMVLKAKLPKGRSPFEDHEAVPQSLFVRGTFYNQETHWYVKKYLWTWKLLYDDKILSIPVPHTK